MISLLLDELPESVTVDGMAYQVNWGYRAMILIEIDIFRTDRSDEQKILDALNIFYCRNIPPNMNEALHQLLRFYAAGRDEKVNEKKTGAQTAKRCYCFDQDAPYIYAAFRTQYGINLNHTKNYELHWWEFKAMFEALNEELKMSKIMYYRTAKLTGLGKEQRRFINEMKKLYALEDAESSMDDKAKLAKRNSDMKAYVRKRMGETDADTI